MKRKKSNITTVSEKKISSSSKSGRRSSRIRRNQNISLHSSGSSISSKKIETLSQLLNNPRLNSLEEDNWDDSNDEDPFQSTNKRYKSKKPKNRSKSFHRSPLVNNLNTILLQLESEIFQKEDREEKLKQKIIIKPNYLTITAKSSRFPPRKICSVCGFKGKYNCKDCGKSFCSLNCNNIHEETRCNKYVK
eukprot:TRINITY_DN15511_c0_g1_i1.p1 TRINITY_DN15511_c0_g1~~TRINITY_DN15511_c0_g1_i1.p1  ORF type:complete len:191 (+),score=32.79 TRINITY_DN15511_c0_g1_i1:101-673(+)